MYNIPVGVYVTAVTDKSAADKAGIESGDVIIKIDDVEVSTTEELNAEKNKHEAGEIVKLTIVRNGEEKDITVTLDEVQNAEKQDKQSEKDDKDED
jgi:serine protease Do